MEQIFEKILWRSVLFFENILNFTFEYRIAFLLAFFLWLIIFSPELKKSFR